MSLLRKSFFILLYLSFLVCFSLQTLNRNSRINFSSSGIRICFVHTQHSYFQVTTLLPFSKKCDSLHVSTLLDQGMTNVTVPCPWEKECTPHKSLFFEILRSTPKCTFIFWKLCLLLPLNSTHRNRKLFYFVFNCTVRFVFCCPVQIKLCVLRGSVWKEAFSTTLLETAPARKRTRRKYRLLDRVSIEYWTHSI